MHKVAVYGTLRQGCLNHSLLNKEPEVTIALFGFDMLNAGPYPICRRGSGTIIVGVYEVDDDTLKSLDQLEQVPTLYTRETCLIPGIGEAFIYLKNNVGSLPAIISGDWCRFIRRMEHA